MLALKSQREENVYLVGSGGKGIIPYRPSMTLRQLIANSPTDNDVDLTEVQLFRTGNPPLCYSLATLLGKDGPNDPVLQPNDVVTLTPVAFLRVWGTGSVKNPGLVRLPASCDPYQAVAASGGFLREEDAPDPLENDVVLIRRRDSTLELPARAVKGVQVMALQPGDASWFSPVGRCASRSSARSPIPPSSRPEAVRISPGRWRPPEGRRTTPRSTESWW